MDTHKISLILLLSQGEAAILHHSEHITALSLSSMLGVFPKNSDALGTASIFGPLLKLNTHSMQH
jgi:hypothetical protein